MLRKIGNTRARKRKGKTVFTRAIVRRPCRNMINGITTADLGQPDYELACEQHARYIHALRSLGLEVTVLPPLEEYPDSCFVEDPAVLNRDCALLTNPGAPSRNGEKDELLPELTRFYSLEQLYCIQAPGTVEGGDVMQVGSDYYIGRSLRSNEEGCRQFSRIMQEEGYRVTTVELREFLHLKSGLSYLENNVLLVTGEFVDHPLFASFDRIVVPTEEAYAANSLWINGTVLVPEGFPQTLSRIREAGYPTLVLDMSEFRKLDGGLSCLSLRF